MQQSPALSALISDPIGELASLCNFSSHHIHCRGQTWPTVEHYFQAQKFPDLRLAEKLRQIDDPREVKRVAWALEPGNIRQDWDIARRAVMLEAIRAKSGQHSDVAELLKRTWPLPIFEDSIEDEYWGIGSRGQGTNWFGQLLMAVRDEICEAQIRIPPPPAPIMRPRYSTMSRFEFIELPNYWVQKAFMNTRSSIALKPTALTTLSIPELIQAELLRDGIEWPPTVVPLPTATLSSLKRIVKVVNPSRSEPEINGVLLKARRAAFDTKYADYTWADDARSLFSDWVPHFLGVLSANFGQPSIEKPWVVIGAGSGEEAAHLWAHFGESITLTDMSERLVANCRKQAPHCRALQLDAEHLNEIRSGSVGLYCGLRTYESMFFGRAKAIAEARRVLRSGGGLLISFSNGYQGSAGEFVAGRITDTNQLDLGAAPRDISETVKLLWKCGFSDLKPVDLKTEWGIIGYKA
jgi:N-glycosidase YbiA